MGVTGGKSKKGMQEQHLLPLLQSAKDSSGFKGQQKSLNSTRQLSDTQLENAHLNAESSI